MVSKQKASDQGFSFSRAFHPIFNIFTLVYIGLEREEANEKEFLREQRGTHELNDFELFLFFGRTD